MTLSLAAAPPPLSIDTNGAVRVGHTRVTLDTVVYAFDEGATAEEIAQQYPSLTLGDVYEAIGYELHHKDDVAVYLREREERAAQVRRENERRFGPRGARARLLARRQRPA